MRVWLIILFFGGSVSGYTNQGFQYYYYSALYGKSYQNSDWYNSFEFQFHKRFNRKRFYSYLGVATNYTFGNEFESFGLKAMMNPTYFQANIGSRTEIEPFILLETNLVRKNEQLDSKSHSVTPGIGFNITFAPRMVSFIKFQTQCGYQLNKNFLNNKNGFTAEAKLGVGLGFMKRYRKKESNK